MHNKVYDFLTENKFLFENQFSFLSAHSTENAILQLSNRTSNSFSKKQFTLRNAADFSKVFDTVNHKILIEKGEKYGIEHQYIDWFKSYLNSGKQYVRYSEGTTSSKESF